MLKQLRSVLPRLLAVLLALGVLLAHVLEKVEISGLRGLDTYLYDEKLRLMAPNHGNPQVVIVDIDERSLAAEGRWPWSRDRLATLLDQLFDRYQVRAAGFDIMFSEPDDSSGIRTLHRLADGPLRHDGDFQRALRTVAPELDYDRRFAEAMRGRPVVLGFYFGTLAGGAVSTGEVPDGSLPEDFLPAGVRLLRWDRFGGNLPVLQKAAVNGGYFSFDPDPDGNARRVPMMSLMNGMAYEALSLSLLRVSVPNAQIEWDDDPNLERIKLIGADRTMYVPLDDRGRALIPFHGGAFTFRYIPATDVLHGKVSPELLADKIVLIGTSAPGLLDLRSTPMSNVYPGVEVHANLIAGILDNTIRQRPKFMMTVETLLLVAIGLILLFALPHLTPVRSTTLALGLVILVFCLDLLAWQRGWLFMPGPPLVMVMFVYLFHMAWGYLTEFRHKKRFADLFGLYVPPELVTEMAKAPEAYSMEGRAETLTVLFSDVRDFTTISEQLSARELAQLMNAYLDEMTQLIRARRGTLDKYIGDAIMAFWGAPVADPLHARHAVEAALDMIAAQKTLAERFAARGWPVLKIGIGVNTGVMTVGDMGSAVRKAYTVMGDAVNLGARLEGLTKQYGLQLLIGESTKALVPEFACREIDLVRVKGKRIPVSIYEPVGLLETLDSATRARVDAWNAFRVAWRSQDWDTADAGLAALQAAEPDCKLYAIYAGRLARLRQEPPGPDWDGVVVFETK